MTDELEELTPEQINLLKSLRENEAFQLLKKMISLLEKESESQLKSQRRNYTAVKSHWYTIYEILWAFIEWINKPFEIVEELTTEEEKEKAVEEVNKSEEIPS